MLANTERAFHRSTAGCHAQRTRRSCEWVLENTLCCWSLPPLQRNRFRQSTLIGKFFSGLLSQRRTMAAPEAHRHVSKLSREKIFLTHNDIGLSHGDKAEKSEI